MPPSLSTARTRHTVPRRPRRGYAALSAMLFATGLLMAVLMSWQLGQAQERVAGTARHLAATVAAEGYALHHWLHRERTAGSPPAAPATGTARRLTSDETSRLAGYGATAPWRRDGDRRVPPRGWRVIPLIGADGQGAIVLRPPAYLTAAPGGVETPAWTLMKDALETALGATSGAALARDALGDFGAGEDHAWLAARFARLDANAVLRQTHAGHLAQPIEADIALGGNTITGVAQLAAGRLASDTTAQAMKTPGPLVVGGDMTVAGAMTVNALGIGCIRIDDSGTGCSETGLALTVPGPVLEVDRVSTGDLEVTGTTSLSGGGRLLACTRPDADLCGGGDLDLSGADGTLTWKDAVIFGTVRLLGAGGMTLDADVGIVAGSGVFETLEAETLDVSGCLRSAAPFLYGENC